MFSSRDDIVRFQALQPKSRVIRVMPNVACLVNASCSVYSTGQFATAGERQLRVFLVDLRQNCRGSIGCQDDLLGDWLVRRRSGRESAQRRHCAKWQRTGLCERI